jgi:hypothetical protein
MHIPRQQALDICGFFSVARNTLAGTTKLKPPLRAGWAKITVGTNCGQNFHPSVFTHYREIEERILDTMQENNSFKLPQMSN